MHALMCEMLRRFGYRITRFTKLPGADVTAGFLRMAQSGFQPQQIIDVGACMGKWSRRAKLVWPNTSITLIEPLAEMASHLDRFCARHSNCRWLNAGASNTVGSLSMSVYPKVYGSGFSKHAWIPRPDRVEQREVSVLTLDHVAEKLIGAIPEIVKIDVEGYEPEVLEGARSLLGKTELVYLETHFFGPDHNPCGFVELTNQMADYGYYPYDFSWFGKRPSDGAIDFCEVGYALKNGVLRQSSSRRVVQKQAA